MVDEQSDGADDVDPGVLRAVLEEHPVRLAVLFGSTVRDERHAHSDVDVAVELDSGVEDRLGARLSPLSDLASALGRDDADLALLADLRPAVGIRAFTEGERLLGSEDRYERHRRGFERSVEAVGRAPLTERFDAVIERIDRVLDG